MADTAQESDCNTQDPQKAGDDKRSRDNQIAMWIVTGLFFLSGWLGGTIFKVIPGNFVDIATLAWRNQYQAVTGKPGEPRTYYVISEEMDIVINQLRENEYISRFERTPIERIAMVTITDNFTETFNRIRNLSQVEAIMSLPLFCH